jgi:integrase
VSSVNVRLSTVKTYAKLAFEAGVLDETAYTLIKGVTGYSHKEAKRVDEKRSKARVGSKKAAAVLLTDDQAKALKTQPDTPQGRRDALLMALLVDHGLRVGELVILTVDSFDFDAGVLTFYRSKIDDIARHELSAYAAKAACAYFENGDAPTVGPVLRGSRKGGALTHAGMNRFAIARRVKALAREVGIDELSPHDCRHFAATKYAQKPGTTTRDLMDFFGWSSPAMAACYQHASEVSDLAVR